MSATCIATTLEKRRPLPVDAIIPEPIFASTHAVTIDARPEQRRLIPDFEGELIPRCRHDMCFSQSRIVNARVLDFLKKRGDQQGGTEQRSVA